MGLIRSKPSVISKPIIILGCNRSGTTLLFRNLSSHPMLWSRYLECEDLFARHFPRSAEHGDRVEHLPSALDPQRVSADLSRLAHNKERFKDTALLRHIPLKVIQRPVSRLYRGRSIRLVEKTPSNTLRVPVLAELFPDARFLLLVRRGEAVVSSLMEGWKRWTGSDGRAWRYHSWHYLAPPGWQDYGGRSLAEICAFQWREATLTAKADLEEHCPDRHLIVRHEDTLSDPTGVYARIRRFCELPSSAYLDEVVGGIKTRLFTTGGSRPRPEKWKDLHGTEIAEVQHLLDPVNAILYETR